MPHRLHTRLLVSVSILATFTLPAAEKDPLKRITPVPSNDTIPVIDFFRPPLFSSPQVNNAGTHVAAMIALDDDRTGLAIVDLGSQKLSTLRGGREIDIYRFSWLADERVIFSVVREKLFSEGLFVCDVKRPDRNHVVERHSVVSIIGRPRSAPSQPIVWVARNAYNNGQDAGVMQINSLVDLASRDSPGALGVRRDSPVARNGVAATVVRTFPKAPGRATWYGADREGELAFALAAGDGDVRTLYAFIDGAWKPCPVDVDKFEIKARGDEPGEIIVLGEREAGRPRVLRRLNALTGEPGEILVQDEAYDCDDITLRIHSDTRRILGVSYDAERETTVWFDPGRRGVQAMVERSFPGQLVAIIDADKADDRFVIATYSDRHPVSYHTLHLSKRSMGLLKHSRPWIDPERMRPQQIVTYPARDGATIEAYLTLPEGASPAHPAPLVVLVHGGPWARDTWGWSSEVQFLASRGYAVFQPNYRGSTGYEWRFSKTDDRAFRKMHEDVTDGVLQLAGLDSLDPARFAIMGGSFGGYLAMCGATFEPDLYRCAVTMAGVFDWEHLLREARRDDSRRARYEFWRKMVGDPKAEEDRFEEMSPLRHLDQVKIPIYVQHGREDQTVSIEQSKRLVARLKDLGVTHQARFDKHEAHGTANLQNRVELYAEIETFLATHLRPKAVATK